MGVHVGTLLSGVLLLFPAAAYADISGTITLDANTTLNLDTAQTVTTGGDLTWTGSSLVPQNKARAYNVGKLGLTGFNAYNSEKAFSAFKLIASSTPIPAANLPVDEFVAVFSNGNNTGKLLVTARNGTSITFKYVVFGVGPPGAPVVKEILNNSSLIPPEYPNYGIAPSSLFIITGNSLADAGSPQLQSSAAPGLQTTLNGASINVVSGGVTVHPAIWYTSPTQIAAVMPAATPVGASTLTVTYRGVTSDPVAFSVVAAALGINQYEGTTAVATDAFTGALITYTQPAKPGQILVVWATGLGADPADSDSMFSTSPHPVNTPLQMYVGGVAANILYSGSAGYPGVNQINMTVPENVTPGCWVSVVAIAGGRAANSVTLPVSPSGGICVDPVSGLTGDKIFASGQNVNTGFVALIQSNTPSNTGGRTISTSADGAFQRYTNLIPSSNSQLTPNSCRLPIAVSQVGGLSGLAAGTISLSGPGTDVTLGPQLGIKGAYYVALPSNSIPAAGGTYVFKGTGGADVGAFTVTLNLSPLLVWTNTDAAGNIDRSKGVMVTWTGGNPGTYVYISGVSTAPRSTTSVSFECMAAVEAQQFNIPAYILSVLPAGQGGVLVANIFFVPLTASGLDYGSAGADIGYTAAATYQ